MRPLRLRMKGFGAFRDETEIDFSDVELVALVGNTGSGKSTVIDTGMTITKQQLQDVKVRILNASLAR